MLKPPSFIYWWMVTTLSQNHKVGIWGKWIHVVKNIQGILHPVPALGWLLIFLSLLSLLQKEKSLVFVLHPTQQHFPQLSLH